MTYDEALGYIHSINWRGTRPGLSRITELCERLGNPQDRLKFIHIAGTNGKGSTSAMLSSVLTAAGCKVGLYTSPYIEVFNERMCVEGRAISNESLTSLVEEVMPIAEKMTDPPTEFELITAIAFLFFERENCDVVVLEVGMGGRLDSTNIIKESLLSVITGIALDHTAFLGDTVEKIAAEKAGIIKEGCPVLFGGEDDSAKAVIMEKARELNSPFYSVDRSSLFLKSADLSGSVIDYKCFSDIFLPLCGLYQAKNLSTVMTAVEILTKCGFNITESCIREGIAKTAWRARFELLSKNPIFVFDGSHNFEGVTAAAEAVKYYFKDEKPLLITGVMADKDYEKMAKIMAPLVSRVYTLTPDNSRSLSADEYAEVYRRLGVSADGYSSISEAVSAAVNYAVEQGSSIIALGSLYMYHDVKVALYDAISKTK